MKRDRAFLGGWVWAERELLKIGEREKMYNGAG
jgi:hypothetical protein